jgi:hypothetical protein
LAFLGISYAVSAARDNHTPTFVHSFIHAIDLEAHQLPFDGRGLEFIGAKYDATLRELEVHRQSHRASCAQKDDTSDSSDS